MLRLEQNRTRALDPAVREARSLVADMVSNKCGVSEGRIVDMRGIRQPGERRARSAPGAPIATGLAARALRPKDVVGALLDPIVRRRLRQRANLSRCVDVPHKGPETLATVSLPCTTVTLCMCKSTRRCLS